jgi:hypothetical protein
MARNDHTGGRRHDAAIVTLAARRAGRLSFRSLSVIEAYWEALRDGRDQPPARAQVDPRGIENALGEAFIAERIAPGVARFRVAGVTLSDLLGMEVRGMPLTAPVVPELRERFAADLERAFAEPAIVEFAVQSPAGFGRPALQGRLLLLPLCDANGAVNCVLGGLAVEGRIGRSPRRLEPLPLRRRRIGPAAPAAATPEASAEPVAGLGEPRTRFQPATPARHQYLRLVHSD